MSAELGERCIFDLTTASYVEFIDGLAADLQEIGVNMEESQWSFGSHAVTLQIAIRENVYVSLDFSLWMIIIISTQLMPVQIGRIYTTRRQFARYVRQMAQRVRQLREAIADRLPQPIAEEVDAELCAREQFNALVIIIIYKTFCEQ
jgi:hypothetical protein